MPFASLLIQDQTPAEPPAEAAIDAAEASETTVVKLDEAATGLWQKITDGNFDQITVPEVWAVLQPVVVAIVLIVVVLILAGWAKRLTVKATTKARVEQTLAKFFGNLVKWAIMVIGAVTVLQTLGVEATSFAAVLAALGFAIGLALSGTLGNVAAGVMLLVFRPYRVGDVISVNGVTAKVDEIELFTTTFDTPDNRRIIMPNSSIFGSTIENVTHHATRRVDVAVGTAYDADLDQVRQVLMDTAKAVQGRDQSQDPVVYLNDLGASSIDWAVRVWAPTSEYWAVKERLLRDIKYALDKAGIGIPFPQRDVHVPEAITVKVANG
ncbi:MAG: mechanosensitive ion channel protein [Phycisphaerales bacterium]|nr:MAG: mechanosensitive ion channel protein [Phycisphaerales bacterium]